MLFQLEFELLFQLEEELSFQFDEELLFQLEDDPEFQSLLEFHPLLLLTLALPPMVWPSGMVTEAEDPLGPAEAFPPKLNIPRSQAQL